MIRNLTFNNSTVDGVIVNSSTANIVNYRETTVYDNTGGQETVFEVYPEIVPHDDIILQPYIQNTSNSYTIPTMALCGNANFFIRIKKNNAGDITINNANSSSEKDIIYKIDDYGYGFFRNVGYNEWIGGAVPSSVYNNTIAFTPSADSSLSKTIKLYANVDEDNQTYFDGLYTAKLIRVPSSGLTGSFTTKYFPYTFDVSYFQAQTSVYTIDVSDVGSISSGGGAIKYGTLTQVSPENNDTYVAMTLSNQGLESTINYTIGQNASGRYRYAFFHITRAKRVAANIMRGAEIHFIQEPYSANRIYYGNVFKDANLWGNYITNPSDNIKYHVFFQFANSEILTSSIEITAKKSENTTNKINVLCIPSALSVTITPSISSSDILTTNYMWGNQAYDIYKLASSANTTYTIQID